jgi:hypothetical protein
MLVWQRGIEVSATSRYAVPHGAFEGGVRPGADAGFLVRRNVCGVQRTERRGEWAAAGKRDAAVGSVADGAVADCSERRALLDLRQREGCGTWPRHPRDCRSKDLPGHNDRRDDANDGHGSDQERAADWSQTTALRLSVAILNAQADL